jgi:hypothetical protein
VGRPGRQSGEGWHDGTDEQCSAARCRAGVVAAACTQGKRTQHGKPHRVVERTINRQPVRDGSGAVGWRRGSYYRGSWVTPMEGRGPGSRRMQEATRSRDWGNPTKLGWSQALRSACHVEAKGELERSSVRGTRRPATGGLGGCEKAMTAGAGTRTGLLHHRHRHTRPSVGESMMSCPRAGCGKSACPVR